MVRRKIIKINEKKCNGCKACIPNCPEGAIQIIDGKARLISDLFCDGLGACIGFCPQDAISIEEREAEPYNEKKTMKNIVKAGENTIIAHLKHLKDHGEEVYFNQAMEFLEEKGIKVDFEKKSDSSCGHKHAGGCPGAKMIDFSKEKQMQSKEYSSNDSQLRQWPVQLTLVPPLAPYFKNKDVLLVADCVGYSVGDFHNDFLKNKSIAIACPKLDTNHDVYLDKLTKMIDDAKINTLTVMTMEVPCCSGLLALSKKALEQSKRKIPIKSVVVSLKGQILKEESI